MRTMRQISEVYPYLAGGRLGPAMVAGDPIEGAVADISLPNGKPAVQEWFIPRAEYFGPGLVTPSSGGWYNAARGQIWSSPSLQTFTLDLTAVGGKPGVVLPGNSALLPMPSKGVAGEIVDSNNWSAFFVVKPDAAIDAAQYLIGTTTNIGFGNTCITMVGPSGFLTYAGAAGALTANSHNYLDQVVLLGVTFSTERGVTLRRNGAVVASDPNRKNPIANADYRVFSSYSTGNRFLGAAGHLITQIAADMSAPERVYDLEAIEGPWLDFYGITRGS